MITESPFYEGTMDPVMVGDETLEISGNHYYVLGIEGELIRFYSLELRKPLYSRYPIRGDVLVKRNAVNVDTLNLT